MSPSFQQLFELWSGSIPLVNAMGVSFGENDDGWFLEAPLEPNSNHIGTGFGGSIASLATLAGWAQTWMLLPRPDATHIVIANSRVRYLKPATARLIARAEQPDESDVHRFLEQLNNKGRAGIEVVAHVHSNDIAAATLVGKFVATLKNAGQS